MLAAGHNALIAAALASNEMLQILIFNLHTNSVEGIFAMNTGAAWLRFNGNGELQSDQGQLPLPCPEHGTTAEGSCSYNAKCVHVGYEWVYQGYKPLLWLPPSFRRKWGAGGARGGKIIIGNESGLITYLELDLERLPQGYGRCKRNRMHPN